MKKLFIAALAVFALSACNGDKSEEKTLLDDVIKIHDQVMGNEDKLMQNKMKLDTLLADHNLPVKDTLGEKLIIQTYIGKLVKADNAMEIWMQKFDPEQKGKSHEEIMAYLIKQKKEVMAVDSQLTVAVKSSGEYLKKFKK